MAGAAFVIGHSLRASRRSYASTDDEPVTLYKSPSMIRYEQRKAYKRLELLGFLTNAQEEWMAEQRLRRYEEDIEDTIEEATRNSKTSKKKAKKAKWKARRAKLCFWRKSP
jgi:hypothetical protein